MILSTNKTYLQRKNQYLPVFLMLMILCNSCLAQVQTDSLRQIIQSDRPYEEQISASLKLVESYQMKNFDSTILEGEKAIQLARRHTDSVSVAELKRQIGVAHYFRGKYDVAARNFQESISILEKSRHRGKLALAYNDLAKLYRKIRDLDKAILFYNKAHNLYRQLSDTAGLAMILNESGVVYEYKNEYREAVNRYTASMHLAERKGDSISVSYSLSNIAGVAVIEKKFELAEKNLLRSLLIRQQLNDSFAMALAYSDLGAAMNAKGDFIKAIDYLTKSNRIAEGLKYPELQSNNYSELSGISQKQGDYQNAFFYFARRTALRDSLLNLESSREIQRLNSQYETARKEQQIQSQQNRIRLQNIFISGIVLFTLLAGLLGFTQYKRYRLKKETQLQSEILKQQAEKAKAILEAEEKERQRIAQDLHDGIGQMMSAAKMNLSALEHELWFSDAEQKKDFEKIISLLDDSCREVRTVSHIMMPNALLKNNLASAIRDFVHKLPEKNLQIHLFTEGLDKKLDSGIETVLYRVVQESVNNVLKHAGATTLDISIIRDEQGISGTIEDNGEGFRMNQPVQAGGIGLKNIATRIAFLKGSLDIDTSPGKGTVIAFHIPLVSQK